MFLTFFVFGSKANFVPKISENLIVSEFVCENALRKGNLRIARILPFYIFLHFSFCKGSSEFSIDHKQKLKHSFIFSKIQYILSPNFHYNLIMNAKKLIFQILVLISFSSLPQGATPLSRSPPLPDSHFHLRFMFVFTFCSDLCSVSIRILNKCFIVDDSMM